MVSVGGTQDTASPDRGHRPPRDWSASVSLPASLSSHVTPCPQPQPEKTEIKLTKNAENEKPHFSDNVRKVRSRGVAGD